MRHLRVWLDAACIEAEGCFAPSSNVSSSSPPMLASPSLTMQWAKLSTPLLPTRHLDELTTQARRQD
jgi:hypothetical protein